MGYQVIYADPPWAYKSKSIARWKAGDKHFDYSASAKYKTMSVGEISELNVRGIADKNSVLFLWVTVPMMEGGFQVLKAWGYKYKTMITWRKVMSLGMGYWFRGQTEHILLGVRGRVKAFRYQHPNFIQAKAENHSAKPEEFRQLIERATKGLTPRIELFARKKVSGWDAWGNEVESTGDVAARLTTNERVERKTKSNRMGME